MISLKNVDPSQPTPGGAKPRDDARRPAEKESKSSLYTLYYHDNRILIENKQQPGVFFDIDRKSLKTAFSSDPAVTKAEKFNKIGIYAVWGMIEIKGVEFLVLVSKARVAARLGPCDIYELLSIKFVTLSREKFKNFEHEQCWEQLKRTKKVLKSGMFFAYNYALTRPFDATAPHSLQKMSENAHEDVFAWNYKALKHLLGEAKDRVDFFVPIVQGFIGQTEIDGMKYVLLSRRSYIMGGTRFNSRGIDNRGHVANFTETEFVLEAKNSTFSMRQLRGSLPFYWEQLKGIKANVQIHQSPEINTEVLMKHFAFLDELGYDKVVFLNLLSSKRSEENELTGYFKNILEAAKKKGLNSVLYEYLDFHGMTKETDFSPLDKDIVRIMESAEVGFNEWHTDLLEGCMKQSSRQKAVVRTNCLDCLDRTNAAQTKIAFYALCSMLKKLGSALVPRLGPEVLALLEKGESKDFQALRILWADNGDAISTIYAGTGATTSSVTRKGDKSNLGSIFDHGIKTISRLYLNNFDDDYKQEVIDDLLVKHTTTVRQSLIGPKSAEQRNFKIGLVSMVSCRNNGPVTVGKTFVQDLFRELSACDFVMFVAYVHTDKPVVVEGPDHLVFATFTQLFKISQHDFGGYEILRDFVSSKFECVIFCRAELAPKLNYFKSETIKSSVLTKPFGCRFSIIFNDISLEVFGIKLESGFFSKTPTDTIRSLLEMYIDKHYDFVFFVGPMEEGADMDNVNKNYVLTLDQAVKGVKDEGKSNRVYLLCSNALAEKTVYAPLDFSKLQLTQEMTINAHSLVLKI